MQGTDTESQADADAGYVDEEEEEMPQTERELADDAEWKIIQKNTFTRWVNVHLKKADKQVGDLQYDLSDGLRLLALIEVLSQHKFKHINKRPNFRTQKLENVTMTLKFLEDSEEIRIVNIDSTDIVDCRIKLIMGLIWTLILHYNLSMPMWEGEEELPKDPKGKGPTPKQRIVSWINTKMPDKPIKNFTTDWNDGIAIGALVDACAPGLCPDWTDWVPKKALQNAKEALDAAEQWLEVPQLIKPEEMISPNLDEKAMMTYLSQFPNAKLVSGAPLRPKTNPQRVRAYGPGLDQGGNAVGAPARFTVETFSAGRGDVVVQVINPSGKYEVCEVKANNDKNLTYSCAYTPTMEGEYRVIITFAGKEIPNSPFKVKVQGRAGDPSKVKVSGPGLEQNGNIVGKRTHFNIDTTGAGAGNVDCAILDAKGNSQAVKPLITRLEEDTYLVEYTPKEEGLHSVNVSFAGRFIPSSPFGVNVGPSLTEPHTDLKPKITPPTKKEPPIETSKAEGPNLQKKPGVSNSKAAYVTGRGIQARGIRVNETVEFQVHTENAGNAEISVKITGPGGVTIPFKVKKISDDVYEYTYSVTISGSYVISVEYGNGQVQRSPFNIEIGSQFESKISAYGPGLKSGVVHKPAVFTVESNDETGNLGFSIEGPSEAKIECHDNGDGSAVVTYYPTLIGEYAIHILCNEQDIPKSPFMATISPEISATFDASKVKAFGPGLESSGVKQNVKTEFTVDIREAGGPVPLAVTCFDCFGNAVPVEVKDKGDGTFTCTYTVTKPLKHTIYITYGGLTIPNCPFIINLEGSANATGNVQVYGPGFQSATRNKAAEFTVDCRETSGGNIGVRISDERGSDCHVETKDNGDGTFTVTYTPKSAGPHYVVHVFYNTKEVATSKVTIHPDIDISNVRVDNIETNVTLGIMQEFDIITAGTSIEEKPTVIVKAENGLLCPVSVEQTVDGFSVAYTPIYTGKLLVSIYINSKPVPNTPIPIQVEQSSSTHVQLPKKITKMKFPFSDKNSEDSPAATKGVSQIKMGLAPKTTIGPTGTSQQSQPGQMGPGQQVKPGQMAPEQQVQPGQMGPGQQVKPGQMAPEQQVQPGQMAPGQQVQPGQMALGQQVQPGQMAPGQQVRPGQMAPGQQVQPGQMAPGQQVQPGQMAPGQQVQPGQMAPGQQVQPGQMAPGQQVKPGQMAPGQQVQPGQMAPGQQVQPGQMAPGQQVQPGQMAPGQQVQPGQMTPGQQVKPGQMAPGQQVQPGQMSPGQQVHPGQMAPGQQVQPGQMAPGQQVQPGQMASGQQVKPDQMAPGQLVQPGKMAPGQQIQPGQMAPGQQVQPGQMAPGQQVQPGQMAPGQQVQPGQMAPGQQVQPCQMDPGQQVQPGQMAPGQQVKPGQMALGQQVKPGQMAPGQQVQPGQMAPGQQVKPDQLAPGQQVKPGQMAPGQEEQQHLSTSQLKPTSKLDSDSQLGKDEISKFNFVPVQLSPKSTQPEIVEEQLSAQKAPKTKYPLCAPDSEGAKVRVHGEGLSTGVALQKAEFIIDGTDAKPEPLGVTVEGPSQAKVQFIDRGDGTCGVEYVPPEPGLYSINVLYNEEQVPGGPFVAKVMPVGRENLDVSPVTVEGPGLSPTGIYKESFARFVVNATAIDATGQGTVKGIITSPKGKRTSCRVENVGDGTYKCQYSPIEEGPHSVEVLYEGLPLSKSPYEVEVIPGCDPSRVSAFGPGLEGGMTNNKLQFKVDLDGAGKGGIGLAIEGPGDAKIECQDNKDGTCTVEYVPVKAGTYDIYVKFNDVDIPGSPYRVKIKSSLENQIETKIFSLIVSSLEETGVLQTMEMEDIFAKYMKNQTKIFSNETIVQYSEIQDSFSVHSQIKQHGMEDSDVNRGLNEIAHSDINSVLHEIAQLDVNRGLHEIAHSDINSVLREIAQLDVNRDLQEMAHRDVNRGRKEIAQLDVNRDLQEMAQLDVNRGRQEIAHSDINCVLHEISQLDVNHGVHEIAHRDVNFGLHEITHRDVNLGLHEIAHRDVNLGLHEIAHRDVNLGLHEIAHRDVNLGLHEIEHRDVNLGLHEIAHRDFNLCVHEIVNSDVDLEQLSSSNQTITDSSHSLLTNKIQQSTNFNVKQPDIRKKVDKAPNSKISHEISSHISTKVTVKPKICKNDLPRDIFSKHNISEKIDVDCHITKRISSPDIASIPSPSPPLLSSIDVSFPSPPVQNNLSSTPQRKLNQPNSCKDSTFNDCNDTIYEQIEPQITTDSVTLSRSSVVVYEYQYNPELDEYIFQENTIPTLGVNGIPPEKYHYSYPIKKGSPFHVPIHDVLDPSKVELQGPGLKSVRATKPAKFTVDASRAGEAPLQATYTDVTGEVKVCEILPRVGQTNVYDVCYTPSMSGPCNLDVRYGGQLVPGAPFTVDVQPLCEPDKVRVSGDGVVNMVTASIPVMFAIDATDAGEGELELSLTNEEGRAQKLDIVNHENGKFTCKYQPMDVGMYTVLVKYSNVNVPNSPFKISSKATGRSDLCKIEEGLREVTAVGEECVITVNTSAAGPGQLTCSVITPEGTLLNVDVEDNGNGTASIYYTPDQLGQFTVEIKFGGQPVPNGVFKQKVVPSKDVVDGDIIQPVNASRAHSGIPGDYQSVDFKLPVGPDFEEVKAEIVTPSGRREKSELVDNHDGTVTVKYQPQEMGMHEMKVNYREKPVVGSPFRFYVNSSVTGRVHAYGPGLSHGRTGEMGEFTIVTKDAGAGGLSLAIEGPSKVEIQCQDNNDGTCSVSYMPLAPGDYNVILKFMDRNIPGSPFIAKVTGEPLKKAQVSVGTTSDVALKIADQDISSLTASVNSPSGGEQPCILKKMPNEHLGISFTPKEIGNHSVNVFRAGQHIANSPFNINVSPEEIGDASKVRVFGEGVERGMANDLNQFTVDTSKAGFGGLSLSIEGPSKADIECHDNHDGTCTVSYQPTEPGTYFINIKYADQHVPGSPFSVRIGGEPPERLMEEIIRRREAADVTQVGSQCELSLRIPGTNPLDMTANVTSPAGHTEICDIVDIDDSHYSINFVPREMGVHTVAVKHQNTHIPGSPFQFTVGPITDGGSHKVHASGPGLQHGTVNSNNEFNIVTREAGAGGLSIAIEGPSKAEIEFQDRRDGSCGVNYTVNEPGDYACSIKFNDDHIPGSPFRVYVSDSAEDGIVTSDAKPLSFGAPGDSNKGHQIGRPAAFTVNYSGAGSGKLRAYVTSPAGTQDEAIVQNIDRDQYAVRFIPNENGAHMIHVLADEKAIPGSPYRILVGQYDADPGMVHATGDGLTRGLVGEKNTFFVNTVNAGSGALNVTVDGSSKVQLNCHEKDDGYEFTYVPTSSGEYVITVKYGGNFHIVGSPFTAQITGAGSDTSTTMEQQSHVVVETVDKTQVGRLRSRQDTHAERVHCQGIGLKRAFLDRINQFNVDAASAGMDILLIGVAGPERPCEEVNVKHVGRNQFTVSYNIVEKGTHLVMVKWGDQHVPGSPFIVEVP